MLQISYTIGFVFFFEMRVKNSFTLKKTYFNKEVHYGRVLARFGVSSGWPQLFSPWDLAACIYLPHVTWQKLLHNGECFPPAPCLGKTVIPGLFSLIQLLVVVSALWGSCGRIPHINQGCSSLQHIPSWYF